MNKLRRAKAYSGTNGLYGVEMAGAVIYDPEFTREIARRIAELENGKTPPKDWEETQQILEAEGLCVSSGSSEART